MTSYLAQANTGTDALVSSRSVTKPGNVTAGAVGVFWLVRWSESASFPPVTPPAGAVLRGTIATGNLQTLCYLHTVADDTAFAYSWTGTRWSCLAALWFDGVDPALGLATTPFQSATGSSASITALTASTVNEAALAWHVNTIDSASGITHTPPAGYTETADVPPWATAYRIASGDGDHTADGATLSGSRTWAAGLVALAPPPTGETGDAALAGTATLAGTGLRSTADHAALAPAAGLAASGVRSASGTAALTGTMSVTADSTLAATTDASATATAALTAGGQTATAATAQLAATAALTASGTTLTDDDITITVGAPHSPWTVSPPTAAAWTASPPHTSDWRVGPPC